MAKKKFKFHKRYIWIPGGIVAAVLIAVFIFGVGIPNIVSQASGFIFPEFDEEVFIDPNTLTLDDTGPNLIITDPVTFVTDEEEKMRQEALNMTVTSNQTTTEQVCDELEFCSSTDKLSLVGEFVRVDSLGSRIVESIEFELDPLSVFIDPDLFIDYRNGFVEVTLGYNSTVSSTQLDSSGILDIIINEEIIDTVSLSSSGIIDENGNIEIEFISPSGIPSPLFTFDFSANFDKFEDEKLNKLIFFMKNLESTINSSTLGLVNQTLFTMDILRDDIQIIITNTEGNRLVSYPQDDRISVSSITSSFTCKWSGSVQTHCVPATTSYKCATYTAPTLGTVELRDSSGILLDKGSGTGVLFDTNVLRNSNYTITSSNIHADVGAVDVEIQAPKSQKNYQYSCFKGPESVSRTITSISHRGVACGTGGWTSPSGELVSCNFP